MNKIDDILDEMDDVIDKAKPFPFAGRMYHGNCKHGTIAAIFDGIANDLSQHKLKSSTRRRS